MRPKKAAAMMSMEVKAATSPGEAPMSTAMTAKYLRTASNSLIGQICILNDMYLYYIIHNITWALESKELLLRSIYVMYTCPI